MGDNNRARPTTSQGSSSKAPRLESTPTVDTESEPVSSPPEQGGIRQFIMEKFEVVKTPLELRSSISDITVATPRAGAFPRHPVGKHTEVFLAVNNTVIFEHVAAQTTLAMDQKVRSNEVQGQNAKRYYSKPVTANEILIILGLQFVFFRRRGLQTLEEQFELLPDGHQQWPITKKRYSAIMGCLTVDFDVFASLLRNSWQDAIEPGTEFCVDETLYAFNSSAHSSPKRYIPRKPHKNGLLVYSAAFKTAQGPYLFDTAPDHVFNQPLNGARGLEIHCAEVGLDF